MIIPQHIKKMVTLNNFINNSNIVLGEKELLEIRDDFERNKLMAAKDEIKFITLKDSLFSKYCACLSPEIRK